MHLDFPINTFKNLWHGVQGPPGRVSNSSCDSSVTTSRLKGRTNSVSEDAAMSPAAVRISPAERRALRGAFCSWIKLIHENTSIRYIYSFKPGQAHLIFQVVGTYYITFSWMPRGNYFIYGTNVTWILEWPDSNSVVKRRGCLKKHVFWSWLKNSHTNYDKNVIHMSNTIQCWGDDVLNPKGQRSASLSHHNVLQKSPSGHHSTP